MKIFYSYCKQHVQAIFAHLILIFQIWGNKKQRYLRKLPWYILLGSPNSGKSSLLNHSHLNFLPAETSGFRPLQSSDHTQAYHWRFSKKAMVIDITTPQPQDLIWTGLLKLIKRYRRQKPLNGALITLNIAELLSQPEHINQTQQQALKNILQTVQQELRIQTPLYLILTKCDLIAGFQEFFTDLAKEDREQIWGIVFPPPALASQSQTYDYFNQAFDQFIARLQERVLLRLETERNPHKRLLITYFPQQMQLCKSVLAQFILQDDQAQIRGIYFVSHRQNGNPHDFLLSALAAQYHLTLPVPTAAPVQEKAYFCQRLFQNVILPEADWADQSPYLQHIKKYSYHASWAMAIFALIFGTVGLSVSYARNENNIALIQRYLPDYQQTLAQLTPADKSLTAPLPLLNTLNNIQAIYAAASQQWLLYFELYQPLKISHNLDALWQRTLSDQFMTRLAFHLENRLQKYQNNPEILYQTLKAYLVFSPAVNANPDRLKPPIAYALANQFSDQPIEQAQIKQYLNDALNYPIDTIPLNQTMIDKTRERLRKVMPVEFAYYELKQSAENARQSLMLNDAIGPGFSNAFNFNNSSIQGVPVLYTLTGYQALRGKKSQLLIKHTAAIYWILGLDKTVEGNDLLTSMTPALWRYYNNDYITYWDTLLANIHITPFNNLSQGIQTLDAFTDTQSPLLRLLNIIQENSLLLRGKNLRIAQHYAALNAITGLPGKPSTSYHDILKNLTALRDYLSTLSSSPDVAQMEFQEASAYLQNKSAHNPIAVLKKQAQQMPAPLNRWLNEIADNSFNLLLQGAHQTINTAWKSNVTPIYQTDIQGRFPFNNQAEAFVNINSFGNFFGNAGLLAQFFQGYLAPFIDTSHSPWRQRQVGGYSLGIAPGTMAQLEKAALIRTMYFQNGSPIPLTQFSITPRFLDPGSSSIYVQLANQNLTYQHGPQQSLSWKWPMASDTQQVNISFSDFQTQNFSRTFDGPWGWFKLLSITQLQTTDTPGHYIWTINQSKHQASFDLWVSNNMPLFNLQILESFSLPTEI